MLGLFVHDHKFPKNNREYYYSYGFDKEFFQRYTSIFQNLTIIGRESVLDNNIKYKTEKVSPDVKFYTIQNLKQLGNASVRKDIIDEIRKSDFLVIRVPSILGLFAVKEARKYKKPYIIEVVGCSWDAIANKGLSNIVPAAVITLLTKRAIMSAEYVVYVTEEFLEKRYPTQGKYIACSNVTLKSVEEKDLLNRKERIKKLDLKEKIIMGTCATIDVIYKGQQDVIKALAKLKKEGYSNIEYQLVGGGDSTYLKNYAEKLGVSDQVKFIGSLKHNEVFGWLEGIDLYVHPSKQEGLSRAIIEAMSKGCPVFGADAGGINELIDKKYIFKKGNVQEVCDIFKGFNTDNMLEQATKNHSNSRKYLQEVLYNRRAKFFKEFIEDEKSVEMRQIT
jgi:glycosyltransferase involved in cell wall biosynthesis